MRVLWHRRDLRVEDNHAAAAGDAFVPVFVFDPDLLGHASPPRVEFLLDSLGRLRETYRDAGSDLLTFVGDPAEVVVDLAHEHGAERVDWNRDYSGLARERDARVAEALEDAGIGYGTYKDAVLHEPDEIFTNAGDPYSVFSYYYKKWKERDKESPYSSASPVALDAGRLPTLDELGVEGADADVPDGGSDEARRLLGAFCDESLPTYHEERDYPAREATSRLSPHLKFGTVGVREVWGAVEDADAPDEAVEEFGSQLAWREFYTQVLHHNPNVVTENYSAVRVDWRNDADEFEAWKRGETGYPIVDAGMRQLLNEAYVHNRVRMVVASFLTKDLLIDWRWGYDWFRRRLADHDTANDNGGWQWAASTGTDSQPYFRVFNPMTQGERYDPEASYVKEYVDELVGVEAEKIHSWHELDDEERDELAPDYPAPVVDHSERREKAIEAFEDAR